MHEAWKAALHQTSFYRAGDAQLKPLLRGRKLQGKVYCFVSDSSIKI